MKTEITPESFARFLEWLSPDSERAGEEYERLRVLLLRFFSLRHCSHADELADETINRVILKCSAEDITNKRAYVYGVAKNIYRESLRRERPHLDIDEVDIAVSAPQQQSFSSECFDKCLERLSSECRNLLFEYFSDTGQQKIEVHRSISKTLKMTQTALRMRIMRCKQKLRIYVQECMG